MTETAAAQGERQSELTRALASVRSRLAAAAEAAGRNVGEIELLPITKFFPASDVAILARLEGHPLFTRVGFKTPVKKNIYSQTERFYIEIVLKKND